ncbi:hypothetical protein [Primorskyibacter sp. S187A]|uniref:hypothetical protein n=1 Tax=Primorskyibacter sp. S187A TaxID=3415130 RepID=UPI003C7A7F56
MRWIVLVLMLLPAMASADWLRLSSDVEVEEALANRTLVYDAYTTQSFSASGETLYITERVAQGRWAARGGQYCSVWPPSDVWTCYDLEVDGIRLRFTGPDRVSTEGEYAK